MKVTLCIDDRLLEEARQVAATQELTLDQWIQSLLEDLTMGPDKESRLAELERLWEESTVTSRGRAWKRDDLYDRPVLG